MKAFKKLSTAKKHNENNLPIVNVGGVFIVGISQFTEISIMHPESNRTTGHITATKLDQIGNGNWAEPTKLIDCSAF